MTADSFLNVATLEILGLGLLAFILDTVMGLLFGKLMAFVTGGKINPLIGAAASGLSNGRSSFSQDGAG
jgi:oxaloacetate decarboxylase beta subunit